VPQGRDPHSAGGVGLAVQAGQGLRHHIGGAGEEAGLHPDRVRARIGRRQVVEPAAELGLAEAFLDAGPVTEPRFPTDVVPVAGGDVGDDEADRPDVLGGAAEGQRELVGGATVRRRERGRDLDPADQGLGPPGQPAGG
jgi:hypothetical protein